MIELDCVWIAKIVLFYTFFSEFLDDVLVSNKKINGLYGGDPKVLYPKILY